MKLFLLFILISIPAIYNSLANPKVPDIFVCTNEFCAAKGADATMKTIEFFCHDQTDANIYSVKCLARCNKGPNVRVVTSSNTDSSEGRTTVIHEGVGSVLAVVDLLNRTGIAVDRKAAEVLRLNYDGNYVIN